MGAGDATTTTSKFFLAKLIRFMQNQNLASPKTIDLLWLWKEEFIVHSKS